MAFKGKVFSGEKKAGKFLSLKPYSEFLNEVLGKEVFPGTLNLRSYPDKIQEVKQEAASERLDSFEFEGEVYGGITVYAIEAGGIEAGLLEIDRTHYGENVAEIVAPDNLLEKLQLEDNDKVEVCHRKEF